MRRGRKPSIRTVSEEGMSFIKNKEGGFQANPYLDEGSSGNPTIGFGHLIRSGEEFPPEGIDEKRAQELFMKDLQPVINLLNQKIESLGLHWMTQDQYDALASWLFNVGTGDEATGSDVWEALSASPPNWLLAIRTLNMWIHAGVRGTKSWHVVPGLVNRRYEESILFLRGFPAVDVRVILQEAGISR